MSRRPRLSPSVEALEARTVLSATPGLAAGLVFHDPGDGLAADTSTVAPPIRGELKLTVTASQAVYERAQPVTLTITETNIGSQPVGVMGYGPEKVTVRRDGKPVWRSLGGPFPLVMMLLQPGQSRVLDAVWPGTFNVNKGQPHTGKFTITVRQDNVMAVTSVKIVRV